MTSYRNTVGENENLNAVVTKFELQFGLQKKENEDMKKRIKSYEERLNEQKKSSQEMENSLKELGEAKCNIKKLYEISISEVNFV